MEVVMDSLMKESLEMHEILNRYIKIHGDIFNTSIRRIIPIPGIFKAINYGQHREDLYNLLKSLQKIILKINENNSFAIILKEYGEALLNTITMLHDICEKLYQKSQGDLSSYSKGQYEADLNNYNYLMENYQSIGISLNQLISKHDLKESGIIKVHILDPIKGYYIDEWVLDEDISKEDVKGFVTPNGELYVVVVYQDGQPQIMVTKKEVWEKQRDIFKLIEDGQDYQSELDSVMIDLKKGNK